MTKGNMQNTLQDLPHSPPLHFLRACLQKKAAPELMLIHCCSDMSNKLAISNGDWEGDELHELGERRSDSGGKFI